MKSQQRMGWSGMLELAAVAWLVVVLAAYVLLAMAPMEPRPLPVAGLDTLEGLTPTLFSAMVGAAIIRRFVLHRAGAQPSREGESQS